MASLFSDEDLLKRINAIILKSIKGIPLSPEEKALYDEHLGRKIRKVREERKEERPLTGDSEEPDDTMPEDEPEDSDEEPGSKRPD